MKRANAAVIARLVKRTIKLSEVVPGPIIHKKLPPELEDRIRKFEPVFTEVYPKSHEEWLEGFQRDMNPESEVRIWEASASAYQAFLAKRAVILPARKEAFGLLVTSGGTIEETLSRAKVNYLSRNEAKELLRLYVAALVKDQPPFSPN